MTRARPLAFLACLFSSLLTPALAQDGAEAFRGKTLTYIVATGPGGGYDAHGRLVARLMQKFLPGATVAVKNVPGGGHLIGANMLYAARPDGLTIGTFNIGLIYDQVVGRADAKFDLLRFSWIGNALSDPRVVVLSAQSKVMDWKALTSQAQPLAFGTANVGSASYVETNLLASALNLPIRLQSGLTGTEDQQAMRRGDIAGAVAARAAYEPFVRDGLARIVAQIGGSEKDAPQLATLVSEARGRHIVALVQAQADLARITAAPPGVAAPLLDALRTAYRRALDDADFRGEAGKLGRAVDPLIGDDVLKSLRPALDQTPETVALIKDALDGRKR